MASITLGVTRCFVRRHILKNSSGLRGLIPSATPGVTKPSSFTLAVTGLEQRALSTIPVQTGDTGEPDWDAILSKFGGAGKGGDSVDGGDDEEEVKAPEVFESKPWNPNARRCGALAMKVGSMAIFDSWGVRHPVTVLQLDECDVIQVKTKATDGYIAMQLGAGERKWKNVNKAQTEIFRRVGVNPKRKIMEFRVSVDSLLPVGFRLRAQHFVAGQKVDVCGTSKGKGFQGAMKRWGFAGQSASHGVSKTHRHIGSTGQCQDPGRVFKGKKMPGRMGNDRVTVQNLKILKIDPSRELLFVRGHVPGQNGGFVRVTDAIRGAAYPSDPPFPSFVASGEDEEPVGDIWCPQGENDPLEIIYNE